MFVARTRRLRQLREAALNLGMSQAAAAYYATKALEREEETGAWSPDAPKASPTMCRDLFTPAGRKALEDNR